MKLTARNLLRLIGVGALALSCASASRARTESPQRIKDSAPERIAATRAAGRSLQVEAEDARWGVDAARERRRDNARKQQEAAAAPARSPFDIHREGKRPIER